MACVLRPQTYLGADDHFLARRAEGLEGLSPRQLSLASGIRLGIVKEVDSVLEGDLESLDDRVALE